MTSIKTKVTLGIIRRLLNAADTLASNVEQLTIVLIENTKALHRIEQLLDEQADIQAQTRDAVETLPQVVEVHSDVQD